MLLELTAPGRDSGAQRPPSTLQVVLDRSGSMSGERLHAAKHALESLIARLDPTDNFGLVTFDDEVAVPIPAGPLADKHAAREAIRSGLARRDDQPLRRLPARDPGGAPGSQRPWIHPPCALRWPRQRRRDRSRRPRADRVGRPSPRRDDVDDRDRPRLRRAADGGDRARGQLATPTSPSRPTRPEPP